MEALRKMLEEIDNVMDSDDLSQEERSKAAMSVISIMEQLKQEEDPEYQSIRDKNSVKALGYLFLASTCEAESERGKQYIGSAKTFIFSVLGIH